MINPKIVIKKSDSDKKTSAGKFNADEGINYSKIEEIIKKRESELNAKYEEKYEDFEKKRQEYKRKLEKQLEEIREREAKIADEKIKREQGYTEERKKVDEELFNKREAMEKELNELYSQKMKDISDKIGAFEKERREKLEKDYETRKNESEKKLAEFEKSMESKKTESEKKLTEFEKLNESKIEEYSKLDDKERILNNREKKYNQLDKVIEEEAERMAREKILKSESDYTRLERANNELREELISTKEINDKIKKLEIILGNDTKTWIKEFDDLKKQAENLKKELLNRPGKEIEVQLDAAKKEIGNLNIKTERLSNEKSELIKENQKVKAAEIEKAALDDEKKILEARIKAKDLEVKKLEQDIERISLIAERKQDRDARISDIEKPIPEFDIIKQREKDIDISEIEWLDNIINKCNEYKIKFSKRIVYAYHTALKTADWSPLTILSGVSGTGKSILPKLYAHFGGMNFLNVSVQPNWDSQESMLGYFNAMDNRFDAKPVLRLLAQSQKENTNNYKGLKDTMTLILLDEMNLAYIELYFAEFLSKLESRRDSKSDSLDRIPVKLGSGLEDYNLELGRNILWTGTINQDETTKSLSDKVLDRGIIINFPRPEKLERREEQFLLGQDKFKEAPLLPKKIWRSWLTRKIEFTDKIIEPYKDIVEEINKYLSVVSRALGHRVWQSVEYYMANYPGVKEANEKKDSNELNKLMRRSFEDQLVQKIMPKLRGIETRGYQNTDCLVKIGEMLEREKYNIVEDYKQACKSGYGFNWNGAKYLKEETEEQNEKNNG